MNWLEKVDKVYKEDKTPHHLKFEKDQATIKVDYALIIRLLVGNIECTMFTKTTKAK